MAQRILVTGGSGQLGTELLPRLTGFSTVIGPERQTLDLTSAEVGADPTRVLPIPSAELALRARRPAYSVLAHTAWRALGLPPLLRDGPAGAIGGAARISSSTTAPRRLTLRAAQ